MNFHPVSTGIGVVIVFLVLLAVLPTRANAGAAMGPRAGYDIDSDNFALGAEAELGPVFQNFLFAPSLDFELGDNTMTTFNADLRLYVFRLPETGLDFYGSAGPTVLLHSTDYGNSHTEIGLSLTAGVKIPMQGQKRYNLEARFGFGDIPDLKLMFAVLFGI
jgi:hypothetical protein